MTAGGFHADTDAMQAHAQQVTALASKVGSGVAAETAGTAGADFGILVGSILGAGIRGLAGRCERLLKTTGDAMTTVSEGLSAGVEAYCGAEDTSVTQIRGSGGGT